VHLRVGIQSRDLNNGATYYSLLLWIEER
jgi:hypothetical protein